MKCPSAIFPIKQYYMNNNTPPEAIYSLTEQQAAENPAQALFLLINNNPGDIAEALTAATGDPWATQPYELYQEVMARYNEEGNLDFFVAAVNNVNLTADRAKSGDGPDWLTLGLGAAASVLNGILGNDTSGNGNAAELLIQQQAAAADAQRRTLTTVMIIIGVVVLAVVAIVIFKNK